MARNNKTMDGEPVSVYIKERINEMTASEKKVARSILAEYPAAGLQPITKLSDKAGVSGPTVIRFVGKLGFNGYPEFQQRLISELQIRQTSALEQFNHRKTGLTKEKLLRHCLDSFESCLRTTFEELPVSGYWKAVELLADPRRRVTCVGGRFSELVAQYFAIHLHQLRSGCRFLPPNPSWRSVDLMDIKKKDVLVVFDFRRYQKDTVLIAKTAADKGATIILITDPYLSPISDFADCVLPTVVVGPSPYDTYLPAIGIVETIIAGLIERLGDKARVRMEEQEKMDFKFEVDSDDGNL